jgi:hypothetical protein
MLLTYKKNTKLLYSLIYSLLEIKLIVLREYLYISEARG